MTITETPASFAGFCQVVRVVRLSEAHVERVRPDFVVLEFDYPSRRDLLEAARLKRLFAQIPMVLITAQHSEALAIWCFRSRFHDYLVQPLAAGEVRACLDDLAAIARLRSGQPGRELVAGHTPVPREASTYGARRARLQAALALVERSYWQRLLVSDGAQACGMADFRFGREFKDEFGMDFREYVLRFRIREAVRLLQNPNASVTEVCYSVGFTDPSYFSRMFKRLVGRTPTEAVGSPTPEVLMVDPLISSNYQSSSAKS